MMAMLGLVAYYLEEDTTKNEVDIAKLLWVVSEMSIRSPGRYDICTPASDAFSGKTVANSGYKFNEYLDIQKMLKKVILPRFSKKVMSEAILRAEEGLAENSSSYVSCVFSV